MITLKFAKIIDEIVKNAIASVQAEFVPASRAMPLT
jgi:hypothetical protein